MRKRYIVLIVFVIILIALFVFRNTILTTVLNTIPSKVINAEVSADKASIRFNPSRIEIKNLTIKNTPDYGPELKAIEIAALRVDINSFKAIDKIWANHAYANYVTVHFAGKPKENNIKSITDNMNLPIEVYLDSIDITNIEVKVYPPERHKKEDPNDPWVSLGLEKFDFRVDTPGTKSVKSKSFYKEVIKEGIFEGLENNVFDVVK